jgi:hypothetical protein
LIHNVIIPKVYWDDIKDLEDEKQIKITLEDIEHNNKK